MDKLTRDEVSGSILLGDDIVLIDESRRLVALIRSLGGSARIKRIEDKIG